MEGRHLAYRIVGGVLVCILGAMLGADLGLFWARDKDGWASLGAAIYGFLGGGLVGLVCGILFGLARPPVQPLHRWLVLGGLAALIVLSLLLQEWLDNA